NLHRARGIRSLFTSRYKALSYTWGGQPRNHAVSCDGHVLFVTRNAEDAMRCLRRRLRTTNLWIDAICINQESTKEKNDQVAMMGEIYARATRVVIWLNFPPSERRRLESVVDLIKATRTFSSSRKIEYWAPNDVVGELLYTSLSPLVRHPYWTRAWTVQEV
ncbi:heterokaryon incompatibility, partial [Immersiella caudata]